MTRKVVNYQAIEKSKSTKSDDKVPYKDQIFSIHTLLGAEFIRASWTPIYWFRQAIEQIEAAEKLTSTNWSGICNKFFNERFSSLAEHCRISFSHVESAIKYIHGYEAFLSLSNVRGLAAWVNDPDNRLSQDISVRAIRRGMEIIDSYSGKHVRVTRAEVTPRIKLPSMVKLQQVLKRETSQSRETF